MNAFATQLRIPVVCAPMFLVSGPELVAAACVSGIAGALPRANARTLAEFDRWLTEINETRFRFQTYNPDAIVGPVAVNLPRQVIENELQENLDVCRRHGVEVIISAHGDPRRLTAAVHAWGGIVFHDVTSVRFAEKAVAAGVDGITVVGFGGGGHSGMMNAQVLVAQVRAMFGGAILLGGGISDGVGVRTAQVAGADLAYMGTRFIATKESRASEAYKTMLVNGTSSDLKYASIGQRPPANWLMPSLLEAGLPRVLLDRVAVGGALDVGNNVRPWVDVWSAGQGLDLIHDIPNVGELVDRLEVEYRDTLERSCTAGKYSGERHDH